jgi:DNA primase
VCEALFDAMTFWVHGFRNVTSAYGAGGVTDELLAALVECGVRRVFIAFDRDAAGDAGAEKLGALLVEHRGVPGAIPERDGCERVRAGDAACGERPCDGAENRRMGE